MKAVRVHQFGGPEVIVLDDVPVPVPHEVLVGVKASGVGPWDALLRSGEYQPEPLPLTLGSDISGVVEAVGVDVSAFKLGDEIFGVTNDRFTGGYAVYKLWNRLASGSYFPPPVRRVEIPKSDGRTRPLGIPTVTDRIAQMVIARFLQPILEPHFHADSYGYRPKKSAKDALGVARQRCWQYDWVLDLDIKAFFETIDHGRLMRAVRRHTTCPWALLYIHRWLNAPTQLADGSLIERTEGTPQGGVISPLLANLYLHYAFDLWMVRAFPDIPFERYADDVICHCRNEERAARLREAIEQRFATCQLTLHPQKTKIAYCKDDRRRGAYPTVQFDFLGYSFRPRRVSKGGKVFVGFNPGISTKSASAIYQIMRDWHLHRRSDLSMDEIARTVNPTLRGWINYYGTYYRSVLSRVLAHLDHILAKWAMRKYKSLEGRRWNAQRWVRGVASRQPNLFAHWATFGIAAG